LDPKRGSLSLSVDLIRTIAIVLVIMLHAANESYYVADEMSPEGVTLWWTVNIYNSLSKPSVPLFVMLTGALLLMPEKVGEPLSVFFKKRLKRIGLPFLFWGTVYFAWRFIVHGEVISGSSILQGVLMGPSIHFWYLYLLLGLYLITPMLRLVMAYATQNILRLIIAVWFLGNGVIPLLGLLVGINLNSNVFLVAGWVGYYVLGAYALRIRVSTSVLYVLMLWGLAWTIVGTYVVVGIVGQHFNQFFYDSSSFAMIAFSFALFLLLARVPSKMIEQRFPLGNRVLNLISQNTLAIFLFHVIVLELIQKGYLGFQISLSTMNPILAVPLITAVTLLICLAVIIPLKKIPIIKRLIG